MTYHRRKDTTRAAREYHAQQDEALRRARVGETFAKLQRSSNYGKPLRNAPVKWARIRRLWARVVWWRH